MEFWKKSSLVLFALIVLSPFQKAFPNDAIGNARLGLEYAQKNCSSCHAVLIEEARSPEPKSLPFKIIANTPGITQTSLRVFLQTSHATMPNLMVKGSDADNLITYILSLQESSNGKAR